MADDKDYEQSALGKRVNELMDDGYDFGEAVKQAMSEGLKDGGAIGIEVLFSPKRNKTMVRKARTLLGITLSRCQKIASLSRSLEHKAYKQRV